MLLFYLLHTQQQRLLASEDISRSEAPPSVPFVGRGRSRPLQKDFTEQIQKEGISTWESILYLAGILPLHSFRVAFASDSDSDRHCDCDIAMLCHSLSDLERTGMLLARFSARARSRPRTDNAGAMIVWRAAVGGCQRCIQHPLGVEVYQLKDGRRGRCR